MANLKIELTEKVNVSGKNVNNSKSHNISGVNKVYQETIKVSKRDFGSTYLFVAEVPSASYDDKSIYIEAHTDRTFTATGDGTGSSEVVTLDAAIDIDVLDQVGAAGSVSPELRLGNTDLIGATDAHDDGADDRILSVAGDTTFSLPVNTISGSNQIMYFYGNQFSVYATTVSGQKYITHTHTQSGIQVGFRVTGTNIGTNAVITKIVSSTEFEVDVASTGSGTNDIFFSDTIKVTFDEDVTQANSTKHIAGVSGIFGAEDNLTNRKAVLTSLKKSLDAWVSAGAPFSIGGISDNGTLPYLKITHTVPGHSTKARELWGNMIKADQLFSSDRTTSALTNATNAFTNDSVSLVALCSFNDTIPGTRSASLPTNSAGGGFSNDNVKYTRITNNGTSNVILYLHVGGSDLKLSARRGTRTIAKELSANIQENYDANAYIINVIKPGESNVYFENKIDVTHFNSIGPVLTEIDNIYAISESGTIDGSVEVFIAAK